MAPTFAGERGRLTSPFGASIAFHIILALALFGIRPAAREALPPIYRVDLVAAPAGPRAEGVVTPRQQPAPEKPAPPPPRPEVSPKDMPLPAKATPKQRAAPVPATPVPIERAASKPAAPEAVAPAGGGPTGDRGTDVATVRTEGIEFPYPAYLSNIVRQVAKEFSNPTRAALRAEVFFHIRRDGSVANIRLLTRSNNFTFDQAALGAVEAAGNSRAFGPLPDGFTDDSLPVIFSFDPRTLR